MDKENPNKIKQANQTRGVARLQELGGGQNGAKQITI